MKKNSKKSVVVTVVVLCICLIIAIVGVLFFKNKFTSVVDKISDKADAITTKGDDQKQDVKEKKFEDTNLISLEKLVNDEKKDMDPIYSANEAVNLVLNNDASISEASNSLKVPKSFIQAILLKEISNIDAGDAIADKLVENYYNKKANADKEDSSTGLGQIFAKTAIRSHNQLVSLSIINENNINESDINARKEVWFKLKDDNDYNIKAVAKTIKANATYKGIASQLYEIDDNKKQSLFAAYNGSGPEATKYGSQVLKYQKQFEEYNNNHK